MAQESYSRSPVEGYAGASVEGSQIRCITRAAAEIINFGDFLVEDTDGKRVRKPAKNKITITLSADFVASNSITGTIKYRAVGETTYTTKTIGPVVYASSHANTMDLLVTELETELADALGTVELTGSVNNRQITITSDFLFELETGTALAITLGSSQATVTQADGTADSIVGIARHTHRQPNSLRDEDARYNVTDAVNVGVKGAFWVYTEGAADTSSTVYTRFDDGSAADEFRGNARASASTVAVAVADAKFRRASADGALNIVELNKP